MTDKTEDALRKIDPINRLLESRFGLRVDGGSVEHLLDVLHLYDGKRDVLIKTLGEAQAIKTSEYAKAVLISEAVRMMIREIAPKRLQKRKR
jgi:hypothetical protein